MISCPQSGCVLGSIFLFSAFNILDKADVLCLDLLYSCRLLQTQHCHCLSSKMIISLYYISNNDKCVPILVIVDQTLI